MKINYGMFKKGKNGEENTSQNFSIDYDLNWDNEEEHVKFRSHLHSLHPGYTLMGYVHADPMKGDKEE